MISKKPVGMVFDRTVNAYFSLILAFFAGICAMSFVLFKCHDNPSGKQTLNQDESIICYEGKWTEVLGIAVAAVLLYVVGCGGLFVWVIAVGPRRFHDQHFQ